MIHTTPNYKFEMPDNSERASQLPFNRNFESLDTLLAKCALQSSLDDTDNKLATFESLVNSNYKEFTNFQKEIEDNYYTSVEIDNLLINYVKSSDLIDYAKLSDLGAYAKSSDLTNYITTQTFNTAIGDIASVYVTKSNLNSEIANLNTYALKTDLNSYATANALSNLEARVKALEDA